MKFRGTKVAIVGSRNFRSLGQVTELVMALHPDTVVVSGGAKGVDSIAEQAAKELGLATIIHPADWDTHGKRAGFLRNAQIVADCDMVVAFWDGSSKGTMHTVELARKARKPVFICHDI